MLKYYIIIWGQSKNREKMCENWTSKVVYILSSFIFTKYILSKICGFDITPVGMSV